MTTTMPAFDTAANVARILKESKLDAKLETLDPSVLEQMLNILVAYGHLSPEQAHQLYVFLTSGGGFPVPPPVPYPDQQAGKIPLYNLLRVAAITRTESEDFVAVGNVVAIGQAIVTIVQVVESVGDALSDAWSWLTGLFS